MTFRGFGSRQHVFPSLVLIVFLLWFIFSLGSFWTVSLWPQLWSLESHVDFPRDEALNGNLNKITISKYILICYWLSSFQGFHMLSALTWVDSPLWTGDPKTDKWEYSASWKVRGDLRFICTKTPFLSALLYGPEHTWKIAWWDMDILLSKNIFNLEKDKPDFKPKFCHYYLSLLVIFCNL